MENVLLAALFVCLVFYYQDVKELKSELKNLKEDKETNEKYIKRCHRIMEDYKNGK